MRFTVIVPVYQQWHYIPVLLDHLAAQTLSHQCFEVILVDNGSAEFLPPESIALENAQVLRCETPGAYAARNHGCRSAAGEWLAFTDADCLPEPGWLEALNEATRRPGADRSLLAGTVEVAADSTTPGAWEIYDRVNGIPQERYVSRGYAATANLAVPARLFRELDGFDPRRYSGGDAELCRRAARRGCTIVHVPAARVEHRARTTWKEIAGKARRVKGGQVAAGTAGRRIAWLLRSLAPPLRGAWRFLNADRHPWRHRLIAVSVLFRIWATELREVVRLAAGGDPERS